eukprot:TRINITY_DN33277_c0_g1_i1.p1 TRINITY_DN33277_c0_g1~~TRINITY_DN33277_c0_g1_i1.p1  ORF type:complete len:298 (+),score=61.34 TRINITY_DN33277_c0_g1_i1:45-938(+)
MPPRLSLVQRQQLLLEQRGFSKPDVSSGRASFSERQEAHLVRTGRANAASSSRARADLPAEASGGAVEDGASVVSRGSVAPSLHPSMAGTVMSQACHPDTVGAGDETLYWDFQHRTSTRADLGHTCRECKKPFASIGEPMTERRGARVSMRYHAACFSGFADPRSQVGSSTHVGNLRGTQLEAAPSGKAGSKMRTSAHFDSGGRLAQQARASAGNGGSGKTGMGLGIGSNGFGAKSSRGVGQAAQMNDEQDLSGIAEAALLSAPPAGAQKSMLSAEALRAHTDALACVVEETPQNFA